MGRDHLSQLPVQQFSDKNSLPWLPLQTCSHRTPNPPQTIAESPYAGMHNTKQVFLPLSVLHAKQIHLDLILRQAIDVYYQGRRIIPMIQSSPNFDNEKEDGCAIVVEGFQKHIYTWYYPKGLYTFCGRFSAFHNQV